MMSRRFAAALALIGALALVLGPALWAVAQPATPDLGDEGALAFRHLTPDQGLPSEVVLAVAQDVLGFVWVGTDEGLARFDGEEVVKYARGADSTALPSDVVLSLAPCPSFGCTLQRRCSSRSSA